LDEEISCEEISCVVFQGFSGVLFLAGGAGMAHRVWNQWMPQIVPISSWIAQ